MNRKAEGLLLAGAIWLLASLTAIALAGDQPLGAVLVALLGGGIYGVQAFRSREI